MILILLLLFLPGCIGICYKDNNEYIVKGAGVFINVYPVVSFKVGIFEQKFIIIKEKNE
ncbi:MAG: hypothetical protein IKP65_05415 [Alphaproteobacteria bacterium]|nr:hypothetical protein [Alphaproteobacteria bacterium]